MNYYLEQLTKVVRTKYGQEAEHINSVLVKETVGGIDLWDGAVEVFGLRWNSKAKRCYAWGEARAEGGWDITTVLGIRPIESPLLAVKAAISAHTKPHAA